MPLTENSPRIGDRVQTRKQYGNAGGIKPFGTMLAIKWIRYRVGEALVLWEDGWMAGTESYVPLSWLRKAPKP